MNTSVIEQNEFKHLPEELVIAQRAIETEEVQEIIKKLAKYNLGVYMSHLHKSEDNFSVLPEDIVAVEENLTTKFIPREELSNVHSLPVAWRWNHEKASVSIAAKCQARGQKHDCWTFMDN